jgi:hypothetical protein
MAGNNPASIEEAQERETNLLINDAIRDTEAEIFADALGTEELDNDGDTSLEAMGDGLEGEDLDEDDTEETDEETDAPEVRAEGAEGDEEEDEVEAEPARGEDGRFQRQDEPRGVPSARLREESEAKRQAQAESAQLRADLAAMAQRLQGLEAGLQAPRPAPQQQAQPVVRPKPDMFSDPEGYEAWVLERAEEKAQAVFQQGIRAVEQRQQQQFQSAVDQNLAAHANGPRSFEFQAAYRTLTSQNPRDPQAQATVRRILSSSDPGEAMFQWWDQNGGEDYRAQLREQLHERLAQLGEQPQRQSRQERAPRQQQSQPRQVFRGPQRAVPSLNGATGANSSRVNDPDELDGSEAAIFRYGTQR